MVSTDAVAAATAAGAVVVVATAIFLLCNGEYRARIEL